MIRSKCSGCGLVIPEAAHGHHLDTGAEQPCGGVFNPFVKTLAAIAANPEAGDVVIVTGGTISYEVIDKSMTTVWTERTAVRNTPYLGAMAPRFDIVSWHDFVLHACCAPG